MTVPERDPQALRGRLWDAVLDGDEYTAARVVLSAVDAGLDVESALLDVIAPVQRTVGAEWAAARISVAQEHTASAINDRVIAALAHHPAARRDQGRGRVTVACTEGEWHALPARLLAETLRLRGLRVDFLGAQVPIPHLVDHLHRTGPDVVALSSSVPARLPAAHATIIACRAAGVPVVVGGAAFGPDDRLARRLGADGWAADARAAAALIDGFLGRSATAPGVPKVTGDLPHPADQEYTLLTRRTHTLVAAVMDGLVRRLPMVEHYTERQRRYTVEDIAHIIEFLAAAVYLDDPGTFTRFITWTVDILTARGVPAHAVVAALELLAERLTDLPRATGALRHGLRALGDRAPAAPT